MKTREEYIHLLSRSSDEIRTKFGVHTMRLFGSVARNEHKETSDIDVCVEMEPNLFLKIDLKNYLEEYLKCPVDVVRMHKNMNTFLKSQIDRDGIYVFR